MAAIPVLCLALLTYALSTAGWRLGLVRAALILAAAAVVGEEVFSAFGWLNRGGIFGFWAVALIVSGWLAYRTQQRRAQAAMPRLALDNRLDRILFWLLAALLAGSLVLALIAPPNTHDSLAYHLPKVEEWAARGSLNFFPVAIDRQIVYAPGAEYLLLHLRLLTGDNSAYNMLQYGSGIVAIAAATRITQRFGGTTRAQLLTALVIASTPLVLLELSSTQTDLVVAAWVVSAAMYVVDTLRRKASWDEIVLLGLAAGLTTIAKATGLFALGPLLIWWIIAQIRVARSVPRIIGAAAVIGALTLAIAGPYLIRMENMFGSPLGPPSVSRDTGLGRHDPGALIVNALRVTQTAFNTPLRPIDNAEGAAINSLTRAFGIDPADNRMRMQPAQFPVGAWYPSEDRAAFPLQGIVIAIAVGMGLIRPRADGIRGYAITVIVAVVLHVTMLKWQEWGNRLLLYLLILGAPLAGLLLARLKPRPLMAYVALIGLAGSLTLAVGRPRHLIGPGSALTTSRLDQTFALQPRLEKDYVWAAQGVANDHRVGMVMDPDAWEYPWWTLLSGHSLSIVNSVYPALPGTPASNLDAIVCAAPRDVCAANVPAGWTLDYRDWIGYARRVR